MQRAAVEVARQEAAKASGAVSPSVDLVAQVGRERLSGHGDFGAAGNAAGNRMIGMQFTLPLYTGGMRGAREQEAVPGIARAQAQSDQARQQVAQQTRAAWLGLTVGAGRVDALALLQAGAAPLQRWRPSGHTLWSPVPELAARPLRMSCARSSAASTA